MIRALILIGLLAGSAIAEDRWVWKRESHGRSRALKVDKDREETTTRSGQNDDISNDYPDLDGYKAGFYNSGPNGGGFGGVGGGFPGGQGGPLGQGGFGGPGGFGGNGGGFGGNGGFGGHPFPGHNPLKGHPSNGILVGPGGPTGIIGRPRPFYNNGYGQVGGYGPNYRPQGFGNQGFPGPQGGFGPGGFPGGQDGGFNQYPSGPGGYDGFRNPNGPNGFGQLQQQQNGGFGSYGLVSPQEFGLGGGGGGFGGGNGITPYNSIGGGQFFDEPSKDKVQGKSAKLRNGVSNKVSK